MDVLSWYVPGEIVETPKKSVTIVSAPTGLELSTAEIKIVITTATAFCVN